MIRFFRNNNPLLLIIVFLLCIVYHLSDFAWAHPVSAEGGTPLYRGVVNFILQIPDSKYILPIASLLIVFIQAAWINRIFNDYKLSDRVHFIPSFMWVTFFALLPEWHGISAPLLANFFLLGATEMVFSIYKSHAAYARIFDVALLVSAASLIYYPCILFFIWVLISISILKPVDLRDLISAFLGLFIPYFLLAVKYFWTDSLDKWIKTFYWHPLIVPVSVLLRKDVAVTFLILIVLAVWSFIAIQTSLSSAVVQIRKYWTVLFWFFVFSILSLFLSGHFQVTPLLFVLIPLTCSVSNLMNRMRRESIAEIIFFVVFLLVIFIQLQPLLQ